MICSANQLIGFYMMETLVVKGLTFSINFAKYSDRSLQWSPANIYQWEDDVRIDWNIDNQEKKYTMPHDTKHL